MRTTSIIVAIVAFATRTILETTYDNKATHGPPASPGEEAEDFRYNVTPEDVGPEIAIAKNQKYADDKPWPTNVSCMEKSINSEMTSKETPANQTGPLCRRSELRSLDAGVMEYTQYESVLPLAELPQES